LIQQAEARKQKEASLLDAKQKAMEAKLQKQKQ